MKVDVATPEQLGLLEKNIKLVFKEIHKDIQLIKDEIYRLQDRIRMLEVRI